MTLNDRLLGVAALLLAAFLTWNGYDLEAPFAYEPVGPKSFPLAVAFIIALCGLRLVLKGGNSVEGNPPGANIRIVGMVVVLAVYAYFFQILGFIVATSFMVLLIGRLFGGKWLKTAIGAVLLSIGLFFLFDRVLDVVLPMGILGAVL